MTAEPAALPGPRPSILLIDDDDVFDRLVARALGAAGFDVVTAFTVASGERALSGEAQPALVLLDINLPDDSGWAVLRHPALSAPGAPPVVILSGTPVRPRRLREAGVAGYLPKPVAMAALTACVVRLTGAAAADDAGRSRGVPE